jgi:hypothetical protein
VNTSKLVTGFWPLASSGWSLSTADFLNPVLDGFLNVTSQNVVTARSAKESGLPLPRPFPQILGAFTLVVSRPFLAFRKTGFDLGAVE